MISFIGNLASFIVGSLVIILLTFFVIGFVAYQIQIRWYKWRNNG